MADNTTLGGNDTLRTDDNNGVKTPVSKIELGVDGSFDGFVAATNPMPVRFSDGAGFAPPTVLLGASSAVMGRLAANDGVDVGDVTINNGAATAVYIRPGAGVNLDTSAVTIVAPLPAGGNAIGSVQVSNTVAVSAASLPLPSGAATASRQPAFGPAGTPAADVLSVQGAASMTPLKVDGSAVTQPVSVSGTVATTAGLLVGGQAVAAGNPLPVANMAALPAGTNTIGGTIAQVATGVVYSGSTPLTPKFAAIAASSAGDNVVVPAVPGKRLRVLKYTIVAGGAVAAKFRSSTTSDLTGAMPMAGNAGIGGAFCPVGLFETAAGEALVLNLSAAAALAGHITYIEV